MSKATLSSSDESTDETERPKIIESSSDDDDDDETDNEPILPKPKITTKTNESEEDDDDDEDEEETEIKNGKEIENVESESDESISTNASVSLIKPKRQNSLESEEDDSTDSLPDKIMGKNQSLSSDNEDEDSETKIASSEAENVIPTPVVDELPTDDDDSDEDCLSQNSLAEMIESQIKDWYKEDGLKRPKRQSKEILENILQHGIDISDLNLNEEEQEKLNVEIAKIKNLTLDDLIFHINHSD